jgi:hypothetical protein
MNELSLDFYGIRNGSQVYFMPVKQAMPARARPYRLLNRLLALLEELPGADARRYTDIVSEISSVMEHPSVQSMAKIDIDVQQLLEDAESIVSSSQRPQSRRHKLFLARNQDLALDQFDASPEGLHVMKTILDEANDDEFMRIPPAPTALKYRSTVSDKALPNPWSVRKNKAISPFASASLSLPSGSFRSIGTETFDELEGWMMPRLKTRFSQQLAALKKMGFSDDDVILQALSEAKGDVQMAAKLLINMFFL